MTKPYAGLGCWVWEGQQSNPDDLCKTLVANHFAWLAIKAHDGTTPFNGQTTIEAFAAAARRHGLKFGIWGFLEGGDPAGEARLAHAAVGTFKADFYIADAETGYEGNPSRNAEFINEFRKLRPALPAALSSFGRIDFHSLSWGEWAAKGFDFMPQAYENESKQLSPQACVGAALKAWNRDRIYPTVATYKGALGILSGTELYDSVKDIALPGVNVWDAQELHTGQLAGLSHLVKKTDPHPKHPVVGHAHKLLYPMNPPRALKLTSPLTRGEDVRDLQKALNAWAERHDTPRVTVDGQFGRDTKHATGVVAYDEGLIDTSASKDTIRLIWHPWLRTPTEHERGKKRQKALHKGGLAGLPKHAAQYIGVAENPPGSNTGYPLPSHWEENFGMNGVPWCGCFAGSMILECGGHVTSRVASCPDIKSDAEAHDNGFDAFTTDHKQAGIGWLALFNFRDGEVAWPTPQHVGIVESFTDAGPVTIEGNTSGTNPSDGGMVARNQRTYGEVVGYARPRL